MPVIVFSLSFCLWPRISFNFLIFWLLVHFFLFGRYQRGRDWHLPRRYGLRIEQSRSHETSMRIVFLLLCLFLYIRKQNNNNSFSKGWWEGWMISLHLVLQTVLHRVSIQGRLTVVDLLGTPFWYALFGCFERGFHFIAQSSLKVRTIVLPQPLWITSMCHHT